MGVSKTWLDETVSDMELEIRMYRRDRDRKVAVYVSEDVKSVRRLDLEDIGIEGLWIEVGLKGLRVLICDVYRPPNVRAAWMDNLAVMLERAVLQNMAVLMMGDFNCDFLRPGSQVGKLMSLMSEHRLVQMIDGPTRVYQGSESKIDLLFSIDADLLRSVGCVDPGLSDHSLIFGELTVKRENQKQAVRMIRCFRSCDWDELLSNLDSSP